MSVRIVHIIHLLILSSFALSNRQLTVPRTSCQHLQGFTNIWTYHWNCARVTRQRVQEIPKQDTYPVRLYYKAYQGPTKEYEYYSTGKRGRAF